MSRPVPPAPAATAAMCCRPCQAPPQAIDGSIRVSFCRESTEEMVHQLHRALLHAVKTLKG